MRYKLFLFILFFVFAPGLKAQHPFLKEMKKCMHKYESGMKEELAFAEKYKPEIKNYPHILILPFLYLKNIELTQEVLNSANVEEIVMGALKEQPTADNLKQSANFPHYAIIYDDSLRVMRIWEDFFCVTPPHAEALLKYCKESDPQLVFYIWGLDDLFVLFDNRISRLVYDEKSDRFSKADI